MSRKSNRRSMFDRRTLSDPPSRSADDDDPSLAPSPSEPPPVLQTRKPSEVPTQKLPLPDELSLPPVLRGGETPSMSPPRPSNPDGPTPTAPSPATTPGPPSLELPDIPTPPPPGVLANATLYARMALAFSAAAIVTFVLILAPWTLFLSPRLQAAREARLEANQPPPPEIVEVPTPVPVIVEVPAPATEPVEPAFDSVQVRAPPRPATRPKPPPEPVAPPPRSDARVASAKPIAVDSPATESAPNAEPTPEPEPVAAATAPGPVATTPAVAEELEGTLEGNAAGRSIQMALDFLPAGEVRATIEYNDRTVEARGTYAVHEGRVTLALVEDGPDGASYTGTVDQDGADGRVVLANGRSRRFKVRR